MMRPDGKTSDYYRDDGCSLHPECLSCPLPRCKYDDQGMRTWMARQERDCRIRGLHGSGLSAAKVAALVDCSQRTVFRVLSQSVAGDRPDGLVETVARDLPTRGVPIKTEDVR